MSKYLNTIGLLLGMVGVAMIFIWGPPQPSFEQGGVIGFPDTQPIGDGRTQADENAEVAAKERCYKIMSRLGLVFIFIGFLCQFIALWIPND